MSETSQKGPLARVLRSGAVVAAVFVVVAVALVAFGAPGTAAPTHVVAANGNTEQWSFGGIGSVSYSCSKTTCGAGASNLSLSVTYYIEWVVIFTQTNVSSTQTMIESQAAANASVSYSVSGCIPNGTTCESVSGNLNLFGKESATGFTNVTTGTVNESFPTVGNVPALAIMNAASHDEFNFSGSYSASGPFGPDGQSESGSASFDFGANEASSVAFSTPLGLVPLSPQPGDTWGASAPFSATGSWTSGYSISVSGFTNGTQSASNWTTGTVSPSGTLSENGTDLGQYTLFDNYTNPSTQVTAQLISLDFNDGAFEAADGYVLLPFGMYGGVFYGISGLALASHAGTTGAFAEVQPQAGLLSAPSGESAYYHAGTGFIGAGASGSTSGAGGLGGPSIHVTAGPEPVSVAESQYSSVLSSSASGSSSPSSFPWFDIVLVVVVVVVVAVVAVVLMTRRGRQRRQAASMAAPAAVGAYGAAPGAPTPPGQQPPAVAPAAPAAPVPLPPPPAAPATPVCPRCGQPSTFVAQYNRYYCYTDKQYL